MKGEWSFMCVPYLLLACMTYFHFPALIWQGNAIRSSRWIEYTFVVFSGHLGTVHASKLRVSSSFDVKIRTASNKIKNCRYWEKLWCLSFSLERIHCSLLGILFLFSHSLSGIKVGERWSRVDDGRWTCGPVSVWIAPFWRVCINFGSANMEYWFCK